MPLAERLAFAMDKLEFHKVLLSVMGRLDLGPSLLSDQFVDAGALIMLLALQSFERSPANLVRMDKDNFVLAVPEADSVSEGISPEQLEEMEKDPHAEHQVMHCFMPCTFPIVTLRHICILWQYRRWCVGSCKLIPDGVTDLHEHKIHARGSQAWK